MWRPNPSWNKHTTTHSTLTIIKPTLQFLFFFQTFNRVIILIGLCFRRPAQLAAQLVARPADRSTLKHYLLKGNFLIEIYFQLKCTRQTQKKAESRDFWLFYTAKAELEMRVTGSWVCVQRNYEPEEESERERRPFSVLSSFLIL